MDGEMVKNIKGSPTNWRLDASAEPRLVEVEDRHDPALNPELGSRGAPSSGAGGRLGQKRTIYLSRKDFERHGFTDGCAGCRDTASGKQRQGSYLSPHNAACRRRMGIAIKTADPDR